MTQEQALLGLITDLYQQIGALRQELAAKEAELAALREEKAR